MQKHKLKSDIRWAAQGTWLFFINGNSLKGTKWKNTNDASWSFTGTRTPHFPVQSSWHFFKQRCPHGRSFSHGRGQANENLDNEQGMSLASWPHLGIVLVTTTSQPPQISPSLRLHGWPQGSVFVHWGKKQCNKTIEVDKIFNVYIGTSFITYLLNSVWKSFSCHSFLILSLKVYTVVAFIIYTCETYKLYFFWLGE